MPAVNPRAPWNEKAEALVAWIDKAIPQNLLHDPESLRRARLITRFGLLGMIFGCVYAAFYLAIGHNWGAGIVILCTIGIAATPSLMVWRRSIEPAGHFFAFVLTSGFFGLCCVEGGVHGHALAWLVSVPLCALLLLGQREAAVWLAIAFLVASLVIGGDLAGLQLPKTYDPRFEPVVSAAGYVGLVIFMSTLGLIFERGRATAYARLQEALQALGATNERLVNLNQEKDEFLSIAAHDLKNPLTVIMANCDMMQIIEDPDQIHKMAGQITTASERMHRLIKDLLDANAIEQGRYASKIEACDVGPLVAQMVEQNSFSAQRKQIAIRYNPHERLVVSTDAAAAVQIIDNLLSNAVKYSPANSTIHVHVLAENGYALITIRDEGPGISEDDQKKLFQKYSRLTAKPTGGESSTGLGLSIAKRLAQVLGGDIECRSILGLGSTFILRLPLRGTEVQRPAAALELKDVRREEETYSSHRN
jgi:signal transduction histidine kinase